MSKDPAFLFYSKDWLEGTAEMMPNEKGVYIDLLCYQHQRGDLPNDTKRLARMVGLSVDEFEEIWNVISDKFEANGERTLNRKLSEVMSERKDKGHTNKIIGLFGGLCKKCELTFDQLAPVRKDFKVANFKQYSSDEVSERLSEWFNERIALLEDANVNGNVDESENNFKNIKTDFDIFWTAYDYNVGLRQAQHEWTQITSEMPHEIAKILEHVPKYVKSTPDKQFRKRPENYLKDRAWKDEVVEETKPEPKKYRIPL